MLSILILVVVFILLIVLIVFLAKSQKRFWEKYNDYKDKIKKASTYDEGMVMINELYKLSYHPNFTQVVKQLHSYLNGKFNK